MPPEPQAGSSTIPWSGSSTLAQLTFWFQILGLVVPGSTYWNIAFGRDKGDVANDKEGIKTAWNFGKNLAQVLTRLKG